MTTISDPTHTEVLAGVEQAMIAIRRSQTRRTVGKLLIEEFGSAVDQSLLAVVDAIEEHPERSGVEVTVGIVAERLGIDPSRASRVVTAAIAARYVRRYASQVDGRRICLELTDTGRELLSAVRRLRYTLYDRLMRDWTEDERRAFADLLGRFTASLADHGPAAR